MHYDPRTYRGLTFHDAAPRFRDGRDTPRAYLERCLETIAECEPRVQAFAARNDAAARAAADASSARWKAGRPLSAIDGMVIGIKDLLETKDMPTAMGCAACRDNFPRRDNAAVWALREAGAVILGKTVTTEFAASEPRGTRNPWDQNRTPGGSSSGSAAAVAVGAISAGLGTQVLGSILRPASFCGCFGFKPTVGAINRGGSYDGLSQSVHGPIAASLGDAWQVAYEIANRVGGDPGFPGLHGPARPPAAAKPRRLAVLETDGWAGLDTESRSAFARLLGELEASGVRLLRRADDPLLEQFERAIADAGAVCNAITAWENRWWQRALIEHNPHGVSRRAKLVLAKAEAMTVADYRAALSAREAAQLSYRRTAPLADAVIALACPGPAPLWTNAESNPRPTGDPVFNYPSSLLFAPAISVPMLGVRGMPVGVQLMGQQHGDAALTAVARWLLDSAPKVAVGER